MKWEYLMEMREEMDLDRLNMHGEDGWELCGVVGVMGATQYIFKRQLPQHP